MSSFRAYKQKDSMQCGIACIQMVCCYFGRKYSTEFISQYCHSTTEGVSLLSISETVKEIGIKTISGRVETNQLVRVILPCILHWNQNHFVVLYKVKKGKTFYIADPAKGLVKYNLEEFKKHWVSTQSGGEEKGIAMFLEPTPAFYEKKSVVQINMKIMEQVRDLNMEADDMQVVLSAISGVSKRIKEVAQTNKPLFGGEYFLTGKEVCERLYISPRTLQDYRDRKIIPYTQFAGKILYKASDLERLFEENYQE